MPSEQKQSFSKKHQANLVVGTRFSRLVTTALPSLVDDGFGRQRYQCLCVCDCGTARMIWAYNLMSGKTRSCGCLINEARVKSRTTHGGSNDKLYQRWASMITRCNNPNSWCYPRYGGRGISICAEWMDFNQFKAWLTEHGVKDGLELDRIDNNGNYEPSNCQLITSAENKKNTSKSRNVTALGETKGIGEWLRDPRTAVTYAAFVSRVKKGWPEDKALLSPHSSGNRFRKAQVPT